MKKIERWEKVVNRLQEIFDTIIEENRIVYSMGKKFNVDWDYAGECNEDYGDWYSGEKEEDNDGYIEYECFGFTHKYDPRSEGSILTLGKEVDVVDDEIDEEDQFLILRYDKELGLRIQYKDEREDFQDEIGIRADVFAESVSMEFLEDLLVIIRHIWLTKINPKIQKLKNEIMSKANLSGEDESIIVQIELEYGIRIYRGADDAQIRRIEQDIRRFSDLFRTASERRSLLDR